MQTSNDTPKTPPLRASNRCSSRKMLHAAHGLARAAPGVDRVGPCPPLRGPGQLALHHLVDAREAGAFSMNVSTAALSSARRACAALASMR